MKKRRHFHAHEPARTDALNGALLATFEQRVVGFAVDLLAAILLWAPVEVAWRELIRHEQKIDLRWNFHEPGNIIVMLLYWGLSNYFGNGRTLGKWVARTRAISLTGDRLGLWQALERALGYGAAILEGGLGFLQFFWDRNQQCAQDRLAETIVIDTRKSAHSLHT